MTDEETIEKLESKISDLESELQDANDENDRLRGTVDGLKDIISDELSSVVRDAESLLVKVKNY